MTSPVEYRYARAKVKPIAGSPEGVLQSESSAAGQQPTAPAQSGAGTAAGVHELLTPDVQAQADAEAARAALAAEEAAKAPAPLTEPTGTAEQPQAGVVPTAAPATSPEAAEASVPADVIAFLKAHPDAEALIEKLAAQGK